MTETISRGLWEEPDAFPAVRRPVLDVDELIRKAELDGPKPTRAVARRGNGMTTVVTGKVTTSGPAVRRVHRWSRDRRVAPEVVVRVVARTTGRTLLYGTLGTARATGHLWRWVRADDYAAHIATKPEFVERIRRRRRLTLAWTGGPATVSTVVGSFLWTPTPYLVGTAVFGTAAAVEWWRRRPKGGGPALLTGRMGSKAVREAFAAAKLGDVRIIGPVVRDAGAWVAMVELPGGVPADKAVRRGAELASAFGTDPAQVDASSVMGHGGRVLLRVYDEHPFAGDSPANPLARPGTGPVDMWERVELFRDIRDQAVTVSAFEGSFLYGGQPGAGKSMSALALLMAVALDPHAELWLTPVKRGVDTQAWHPICSRLSTPDDTGSVVALLGDLVEEMGRRYDVILSKGAKKLDPAMGEPLVFLWVDELAGLCLDPDHGKAVKELLRKLAAEGRAAGIVPVLLTQKPEDRVIPSFLRDLIKYRWAGRCATPEMSDTVLGRGYAARGFNAMEFAEEHRGAGLFLSEPSRPARVRGFFTPDAHADDVARRAYELRKAAGTLPTLDDDPRTVLLRSVLDVIGERDRVTSAELADKLDQADDVEHLATLLRPFRVTPGPLWIGGATKRGYERAAVESALDGL
ncbi:hypothetical protein LO772_19400 [Yinghuangia sp. ASG 101]|uniref:FtsK/SpoIIIE domain-containing protein n=1 Tax=Yinghuangia sp. ASG 101 TaxID=2896848 RepID=UPI001E3B91CD|nr:FtsK/SpoIIIE domain-containing protein [Yinghuangia sp. ASG 101]UGQ09124.1 hypothetical protein LO772_19400 [Yinghuangia sp. ASG 101]